MTAIINVLYNTQSYIQEPYCIPRFLQLVGEAEPGGVARLAREVEYDISYDIILYYIGILYYITLYYTMFHYFIIL